MPFGVNLDHLVAELIWVLPTQLLIEYLATVVLPVRRIGLYWAIQVVLLALALPFRAVMPYPLRMVLGTLMIALAPLMAACRPLPRVLTFILMNMGLALSEIAIAILMVVGMGSVYDVYAFSFAERPLLMLAIWVGHLALVAVLMGAVWLLVRRLFGVVGGRAGRLVARETAEASAPSAALRQFIWFPAVQIALVFIGVTVVVYLRQGNGPAIAAMAAVLMVCVVADGAMFLVMTRSVAAQRAAARAEALQRQIDAYLESYVPVVHVIEDASQLRHDLRNHVQVAGLLAERGECERAREHVQVLRQRVEGE